MNLAKRALPAFFENLKGVVTQIFPRFSSAGSAADLAVKNSNRPLRRNQIRQDQKTAGDRREFLC